MDEIAKQNGKRSLQRLPRCARSTRVLSWTSKGSSAQTKEIEGRNLGKAEGRGEHLGDMLTARWGMRGPNVTLVFGGWREPTCRKTLLQQLNSALTQLNMKGYPVSLPGFSERVNESYYMLRQRMVEAVGKAAVFLHPDRTKKLSCSQQTQGFQGQGLTHAAWVRRAVREPNECVEDRLDFEYDKGEVWHGQELWASAAAATWTPVGCCDRRGEVRVMGQRTGHREEDQGGQGQGRGGAA